MGTETHVDEFTRKFRERVNVMKVEAIIQMYEDEGERIGQRILACRPQPLPYTLIWFSADVILYVQGQVCHDHISTTSLRTL